MNENLESLVNDMTNFPAGSKDSIMESDALNQVLTSTNEILGAASFNSHSLVAALDNVQEALETVQNDTEIDWILLWKILLIRYPRACLRETSDCLTNIDQFYCTLRDCWRLAGRLTADKENYDVLSRVQQELIKQSKGKSPRVILTRAVEPFCRVLCGVGGVLSKMGCVKQFPVSLENAFLKTYELAAEGHLKAKELVKKKLSRAVCSALIWNKHLSQVLIGSPRLSADQASVGLAAHMAGLSWSFDLMRHVIPNLVLTINAHNLHAVKHVGRAAMRHWLTLSICQPIGSDTPPTQDTPTQETQDTPNMIYFKQAVEKGSKRNLSTTLSIIAALLPSIHDLLDDEWLVSLLTTHLRPSLESKDEARIKQVLCVLKSFRPMETRNAQLVSEVISLIKKAVATVQVQPRTLMLEAAKILCEQCRLQMDDPDTVIYPAIMAETNEEPRRRLLSILVLTNIKSAHQFASTRLQSIQPGLRSETLFQVLLTSESAEGLEDQITWCLNEILANKDKLALRSHVRVCLATVLHAHVRLHTPLNISPVLSAVPTVMADPPVTSGDKAQVLIHTLKLLLERDTEPPCPLKSIVIGEAAVSVPELDISIVKSLLSIVDFRYRHQKVGDKESMKRVTHTLDTLKMSHTMRLRCLAALTTVLNTSPSDCLRDVLQILFRVNPEELHTLTSLDPHAPCVAFLVALHPSLSSRHINSMHTLKRLTKVLPMFPPSNDLSELLGQLALSPNPLCLKPCLLKLFSLPHSFFKEWADHQTEDCRSLVTQWRETLSAVVGESLLPLLDGGSLRAIDRKAIETRKIAEKPVVTRPKAKTSAAAKALLKKAAPVKPTQPVTPTVAPEVVLRDATAKCVDLVCECLKNACRYSQDLTAPYLPRLVIQLQSMLDVPYVAHSAYGLLHALCESCVEKEAVRERRLIPECLLKIKIDTKLPVAMAETICTSLSEETVLSTEASTLVLPVIAFLLSDQAAQHVSLVAVHRAASVLDHQLRLGAEMNADDVLQSVGSILSLRPNMANLCASILSNVPRTTDFKPQSHLNGLSTFLETDNMTLRQAVATLLRDRVRLNEPLRVEGCESFLIRVHALTHDTNCKEIALELVERDGVKEAYTAFLKDETLYLETFIDRLSSPSDSFLSLVSTSMAEHLTGHRDFAIKQITDAWSTKYAPAEPKSDDLRIQGFEMRPEDMEALRRQMGKPQEVIQETPRGRYGIIAALGALAALPDLSIETIQVISSFILTQALSKQIEETLYTTIDHLGSYLCTANVKFAPQHIDFLKDEILKQCSNEFNRSVCLMMLGVQTKHVRSHTTRIQLVEDILETELLSPTNALRVKKAIGKSLGHVISALLKEGDIDSIMDKFKDAAINVKDVKVRVGGALGVAAVSKAQGILYLRDSGLITDLSTICVQRKETHARHGGFLCFEAILDQSGRMIESYAPQILTTLLSGFSDMQSVVREAATIVARKLMACLSGSGLNAILPELLKVAAESTNWRSKVGAIELLGHVASVSPSHLVNVLNKVMPVLCENAHDPHKEVKAMAGQALSLLIKVVINPELKTIDTLVFQAMIETSEKNLAAVVDKLIHMEFRHYLDGTCLAFIIPLIRNALRASRAETRQKSAHLLAVLPLICVSPETVMTPYLKPLITQLIANLNDPLPEVRQAAARCLGLLTETVGGYHETIPFLIKSLKTSQSSVERSGAANALVEIFYALGPDVLEEHLGDILKQADCNPNPGVREGFLGLFVYMPLVFGETFERFVPQVLPILLRALSAEEEPVRDIAYRASQIFVSQYGATHTPLLLQPLEIALFDPHVEVRLRAVTLLGALVEKILKGVEDSGAQGGQLMQLEILSLERRAYILSSLYLARSDEEPDVRSAAGSTWKTVVQNTPKTVRELLPILTKRVLNLLSAGDPIQENIASRCMEELVVKHGDRLVPEVMAVFMESLKTGGQIRGVFIGLEALIKCAPRSLLREHMNQLTPLIRDTLKACGDDSARKQIVSVINALGAKQDEGGSRRGRFYEPFLVELFEPPVFERGQVSEKRMDSIKTVEIFVVTQTSLMLEEIFKRCLNAPEIDLTRIWAMGMLQACPSSIRIETYWSKVVKVLSRGFASRDQPAFRAEIKDAAAKLLGAFPDSLIPEAMETVTNLLERNQPLFDGGAAGWGRLLALANIREVNVYDAQAMHTLCVQCNVEDKEDLAINRGFAFLLAGAMAVVLVTQEDRDQLAQLFQVVCTPLLRETDAAVLELASETLSIIVKGSDRDHLTAFGEPYNNSLNHIIMPALPTATPPDYLLPALSKKVILEQLLTILQTALLYGPLSAKESAAEAFYSTARSATPTIFSAIAVRSVGPLIRVFADRVPPEIKVNVLKTLTATLKKTGAALRPLVAQLQSTFIKCLLDPTSEDVRLLAATALEQLAPLAGARIELLIKELAKLLSTAPDGVAVLAAVAGVYRVSGSEISSATTESLWDSLLAYEPRRQEEDDVVPIDTEAVKSEAMGVVLAACQSAEVWQHDVIPQLHETVVLQSVRHALKTGDTKKWLQAEGLMKPLADALTQQGPGGDAF